MDEQWSISDSHPTKRIVDNATREETGTTFQLACPRGHGLFVYVSPDARTGIVDHGDGSTLIGCEHCGRPYKFVLPRN
jgi:hypothetical protein